MSEKTGTTITCDRHGCGRTISERNPDDARQWAEMQGWTRTEDGRDFCLDCTTLRASRKKPRDLVPAGVTVRRALEAAEVVGWERRDEGAASRFFCCGSEVEYFGFLGDNYAAKCEACGSAIESVFAPSFGNSSVAFVDSDKVDTEDPEHWYVVAEMVAAKGGAA